MHRLRDVLWLVVLGGGLQGVDGFRISPRQTFYRCSSMAMSVYLSRQYRINSRSRGQSLRST